MENNPARPITPFTLLLAVAFLAALVPDAAHPDDGWTGRRIMDEVFSRHQQFPYTFERQTMILLDAAGHRDTRKLRRLSRIEPDGTLKYLLAFDQPPEVRGVALLAVRHPSGAIDSGVYLPAFGPVLKRGFGDARGARFLGTDFAVEDLTAEVLTDFRYVRKPDTELDGIPCFVVDAHPTDPGIARTTGYGLKRHFVRRDILFPVRTDYFDRRGRLRKRQTQHDLKRVDGDRWRADMILMEDRRERHKTLVKTDRRVFSRDYVPEGLFTEAALLANRHVLQPPHPRLTGSAAQETDGPAADAAAPAPVAPQPMNRPDS